MTNSKLDDNDYLQLWQYFEDRADEVKGRMFQLATWVIGFAAGVLGFIYGKFFDLSGPALVIKEKRLIFWSCIIGLLLCGYAGLIIYEHRNHIKRNWDRSKLSREPIKEELKNVLTLEKPLRERRLQAWWQAGIVVLLFALAFVVTLFLFATG